MSQAQELGRIYNNLEKVNGIDVEELVYGPEGFLYNEYPEEWNEVTGRFCYNGMKAPVPQEKKNRKTNFHGDIVYCERLWKEFVKWCYDSKNISLKPFHYN